MEKYKKREVKLIPFSQEGEHYVKLAWWVWGRYFPRSIKDKIGELGLLPDLRQEIALIAWKGYLLKMKEKEFLSFSQKKLYRFLVANGFRKPRGSGQYIRKEEPYPAFFKRVWLGDREKRTDGCEPFPSLNPRKRR